MPLQSNDISESPPASFPGRAWIRGRSRKVACGGDLQGSGLTRRNADAPNLCIDASKNFKKILKRYHFRPPSLRQEGTGFRTP